MVGGILILFILMHETSIKGTLPNPLQTRVSYGKKTILECFWIDESVWLLYLV